MALLKIVRYPDPFLRKPTKPVGPITKDIEQLYADMTETMFAHNGAGLAAIQVGRLERMFLVDAGVAGLAETDPPVAFLDPEILLLSDETESTDEGCLSFPGIYVPVKRSFKAKVRARNLKGETFEADGEGLYARAMQHEHDHLTGRLLIDWVGALKKQMITRKLRREALAEDGGEEGETHTHQGPPEL
jgi:peptide deformylase